MTKTMTCNCKPGTDRLSLAALEAAITAYYDGLGDAEVEENRAWGEFAETHLALKKGERAARP